MAAQPEFKPHQPPQETESLNPSFYQLCTEPTRYLMKDVHNSRGEKRYIVTGTVAKENQFG